MVYLEILDGPQAGSRFPAEHGHRVGRRGCEITIEDRKISSTHGIIKVAGGLAYLMDQSSANGIVVGTDRVRELLLAPGTEFRLGGTHVRVLADAEPVAQEPHVEESPSSPPWREALSQKLLEISRSGAIGARKHPVRAFARLVELELVGGPQPRCKWQMGYGPRTVGSKDPEFQIWDPGAPSTCFYLRPDTEGLCLFSTPLPHIVKLNGESVTERVLRVGDEISIRTTRLRVASC